MMSIIFFYVMIPALCFSNFSCLNKFSHVFLYFNVILLSFNCYFSKISYFLGLDLYSYSLISMSFLICSFMVISMQSYQMFNLFMLVNFTLGFFLFLIFSFLDFLYMYMSFEFVLVPLMILILGWGYQPERLLSGLYLFFYTVVVSLPLLMLMVFVYYSVGSLFFDYLKLNSDFFLVHFVVVFVFLVKLPMYFVHFWLPSAHVQAPVSGSMILAGLMLKIGGYGLIRFMFMYEFMYMYYSFIWFSLSLVGSFLISMVCLVQGDMKFMIAYSSVSHMGLVIVGLLSMSAWGLIGSFMLMLGHGFCSSAMFYMANIFYIRTASRSFYINKGLLSYMPSCSMLWFLFCCFNMSCPPSINFLSEFMILGSMMGYWFFSLLFFIGISFFCACFSYYLYSYTHHGLYHNVYSFSSLTLIEFLCLFMHLIPLISLPFLLKVLV